MDSLNTIENRNRKFVFFGHSLGALVAFEIARELRRRQLSEPLALFMSAYPAPHLPRARPLISHLPKAEFREALIENFDVSSELTANQHLFDYHIPVASKPDF